MTGRTRAEVSSNVAKKRRTSREMREKVQSQGAFSARAHERSAEIGGEGSGSQVCELEFPKKLSF